MQGELHPQGKGNIETKQLWWKIETQIDACDLGPRKLKQSA